jgi:hypothetical protein
VGREAGWGRLGAARGGLTLLDLGGGAARGVARGSGRLERTEDRG